MFLSRLVLNPRHPAARRDLASPYELHATLYRAFADPMAARVLWRLESARRPVVLVQSLQTPDFGALGPWGSGEYLLEAPQTKPLEPMLARLRPGQVLRFRLEANPTVTRQGKRHGLYRVEAQLQWLQRQGDKAGFEVVGAAVTRSERRSFPKRGQQQLIVLQVVRFDGHLRVVDPQRLREGMARGFGHGKALGLGLLTVAPQG